MIVTNLQTLLVTFTANVAPYMAAVRSTIASNAVVNSTVTSAVSKLSAAATASAAVVQQTATSALALAKSTAMSIKTIVDAAAMAPEMYGTKLVNFFTQTEQAAKKSTKAIQKNILAFNRNAGGAGAGGGGSQPPQGDGIDRNIFQPAKSSWAYEMGKDVGILGRKLAVLGGLARQHLPSLSSIASAPFQGMYGAMSALSTSMHNTLKGIDQFSASWVNAGKHIRAAGKLISLYVSAPILMIAGLSTNSFAKFDQAMTETFARMGRQSKEVRGQMEDLAMSLSTKGTITFSPVELAKGYTELGAAGLDAAQSMAVIEDVAILAQAGMFDIDVAVKQLVGSMASFGAMSNDPVVFSANLQRFSDVMVSVANTTTTGVEEVARAMSADGAVAAKNYGMTIEELGAILGVYAMQNKDAEEAGHLTGRAIRLLTASFQRNGQTWKKFGIDLVDKSTGQYVKFSKAIKMIEKSMGNMSGPMRTAFLDLLGFETLAQKSILPLIGQSAELERQEELYKQVGTAEEMAKIQMESFTNQMKILWNVMTVVGIEVGKILAPAIYKLTKYVADGLAYWRTLSQEMKTVSVYAALVVAAIGPVVVLISVVTSLIGYAGNLLTFVFRSLLTVAASAAVSLLLIAVAGYAIYAMVSQLIERGGGLTKIWTDFSAAAQTMWAEVSVVFEELYALWVTVSTGFAEVGLWAFDLILGAVKYFGSAVLTYMGLTWQGAISWIAEWLRFTRFAFLNAGMIAGYLFTKLELFLVKFQQDAYHTFTVVLPMTFMYVVKNFAFMLDNLLGYSTTVLSNLASNIVAIFSNLPGLIAGTTTWSEIWTPLGEGFKSYLAEFPEIPVRDIGGVEGNLMDEVAIQEKLIANAYAEMVAGDDVKKKMAAEQKALADAAAKGMNNTGDSILKAASDLNKKPLVDPNAEDPNAENDKASTSTAGLDAANTGRWSNEALHRIAAYTEAGPGMPYGKVLGVDGNLTDPIARATTATGAALEDVRGKEEAIEVAAIQKRMEGYLAKAVAIMLKFQADNAKPVDGTLLPANL